MHANVKDYLWLNLKDLPYFRALLRAVEAQFYQGIVLDPPVLDLGCGDGHFASVAFDHPLAVGMDPWRGPLKEAAGRRAYLGVLQGSGYDMPYPDGSFGSVVSNSVLEHIPEVEVVLQEVARVLQPGGLFVFCVPNQNFTQKLSLALYLDRLGLGGLAGRYRRWFNRISRHHHCDAAPVWLERLKHAGLSVERHWDYFSPAALRALEWGHYFGLPSLLSKRIFGRWVLIPRHWNLRIVEGALRRFYVESPDQPEGCYSFYIARKPA